MRRSLLAWIVFLAAPVWGARPLTLDEAQQMALRNFGTREK